MRTGAYLVYEEVVKGEESLLTFAVTRDVEMLFGLLRSARCLQLLDNFKEPGSGLFCSGCGSWRRCRASGALQAHQNRRFAHLSHGRFECNRSQRLADLIKDVSEQKDIEGYVLMFDDGRMYKVKSRCFVLSVLRDFIFCLANCTDGTLTLARALRICCVKYQIVLSVLCAQICAGEQEHAIWRLILKQQMDDAKSQGARLGADKCSLFSSERLLVQNARRAARSEAAHRQVQQAAVLGARSDRAAHSQRVRRCSNRRSGWPCKRLGFWNCWKRDFDCKRRRCRQQISVDGSG